MPYPLVFGGAIRVYYLIKMLASFSDVTLVSFTSWSDVSDVEDHLATLCDRYVLVDGKPEQTGRLRARSMLSRWSFQRHAHHTAHMQDVIDEVTSATTFDTIVVTLSQMGSYRLPHDGPVRVLDTHNIEYELLSRRAAVERRLAKRAGLWLEAKKFQREELHIARSFELVLTPSDRERAVLVEVDGMPPVATIPNTIDPERIPFLPSASTSDELLFVGTTQVDANRDGLIWFVTDVLPLIEREVPTVSLTIVGGAPPPEVVALAERPNVTVTGYVPDVAPSMAQAAVFVVPLRSGGGTRLKILESLAYGVPTVSTTVGAEGLDLTPGEDLLLGDEPPELAARVVDLLRDRALGDRIRRHGRTAVETSYSWQAVGTRLEDSIAEVHARRS
jgi:glycosyltransferase involved in cell wall biosynthesis